MADETHAGELSAENKARIASGKWTMENIPWVDQRLWDKMLEIFGASNVHIVASTTGGPGIRGNLLLNSKARRNMRLRRKEFTKLVKDLLPS